jgi:hypothetical protein
MTLLVRQQPHCLAHRGFGADLGGHRLHRSDGGEERLPIPKQVNNHSRFGRDASTAKVGVVRQPHLTRRNPLYLGHSANCDFRRGSVVDCVFDDHAVPPDTLTPRGNSALLVLKSKVRCFAHVSFGEERKSKAKLPHPVRSPAAIGRGRGGWNTGAASRGECGSLQPLSQHGSFQLRHADDVAQRVALIPRGNLLQLGQHRADIGQSFLSRRRHGDFNADRGRARLSHGRGL